MTLALRPITLREAKRFTATLHRHNGAPHAWIVGVGVTVDDKLVGVGVLARPVARHLDDGRTAEIIRVCTDGTRNACSKLYGALSRVASGLGYRDVITYTLRSETGASLRASGFLVDNEEAGDGGWDRPGRPRVDVDLFGNDRTPPGPKIRWRRSVA